MSSTRFVNSGVLLFIDSLVVAASGWIYWIMISKLTTSSEIGQATTIFSLVTVVAGLTQLGLEYPLLKKTTIDRSKILGTALVIELLITMASIPIMLFVVNDIFHESFKDFVVVAIVLLILAPAGFVPRFALLGVSRVRTILLADVIGIGIRFISGYVLVTMSLGAQGILWSYLLSSLAVTGATMIIAAKSLGVTIGSIGYLKELARDGLANTPAKLSRMLVLSLSVVLLSSFGLDDSSIGIFYIALMVSVVAGGLAASIAFMVLPASTTSKTDLSTQSARIGLSLTAPLIAGLMVSPSSVLALIGPEYVSASTTLFILSIAIFPTSIVYNAISKFNNLNKQKQLITIGSVEIAIFLIAFWILVPLYGTAGAALSILVSFSASAVVSIIWSERILLRYIATSVIAIILGWLPGYTLAAFLDLDRGICIILAIVISLATVLVFKNTSTSEMAQFLKMMVARK